MAQVERRLALVEHDQTVTHQRLGVVEAADRTTEHRPVTQRHQVRREVHRQPIVLPTG